MEQEKLNKILHDHKEWLETDGKKGMCANLYGADLHRANLRGANLRCADLRWANLRYANLSDANLEYTDLYRADLRRADFYYANLSDAYLECTNLRGANFRYANLRNATLSSAKIQGANFFHANFYGADLPSGIYVAGGIGSMRRNTYYDAINDCIICGCWDDDAGNHLDSFKKRIEGIYGPDGKEPNPAHYKAYRAAIQYFEACRKAYIVEDCHEKEYEEFDYEALY
ncbi:pentapeptide repeat-containing protein [Selenomonas sp. WCA-380-WT-3B 3/]|uniref:Pentapeptide repeat-containing protein n=1 Tax=Selenomonas montiformis TaxID=2652285 RepID=A0A6I2UVU4_9FIRM|nr:pentapeptide repeat-containing protein [Selenomonas montiformis]MSV24210.1 pentapeptide repeat-containing protein [Selenomonas montiformis]